MTCSADFVKSFKCRAMFCTDVNVCRESACLCTDPDENSHGNFCMLHATALRRQHIPPHNTGLHGTRCVDIECSYPFSLYRCMCHNLRGRVACQPSGTLRMCKGGTSREGMGQVGRAFMARGSMMKASR
jgi:hypothetical protein